MVKKKGKTKKPLKTFNTTIRIRILNIIAVAKNLIPSASNLVIRKIIDDNF